MPEKLRNGELLIDEGDIYVYATIMISSMIFFFAWFAVMEKIFKSNDYFDKSFLEKSNDDKYWRIQFLVLATHHSIVPITSTYFLYNSCNSQNGSPFGAKSAGQGGSYRTFENQKHWGWLEEDYCF
jgi:hypothetical protein